MRIIRDPKVVHVVVEKSRWEIWKLLRDSGLKTAEEIAEVVNKNISTIYRHLNKLVEIGFVKEHIIKRDVDKKYVIKAYSAEMNDAFFILSEEAEELIASQPGEISYLSNLIPNLLYDFKLLGFTTKSQQDNDRAFEIIANLIIRLSNYLGDLLGDENELITVYTHRFEVMRRIISMFLTQTDPEYAKHVEELRKILLTD